jgi:hypothetical protein
VARDLGIGMVYQHFTVVPGMTVAENLLLARGRLPAVVDWKAVRADLTAFLQTTPFRLDLDATPADLSAGEKQKLEILKQLYLRPRLLILDEPTSVLTPQEADEVLGALAERAHAGHCSIVLITHKFREVTAYMRTTSACCVAADSSPAARWRPPPRRRWPRRWWANPRATERPLRATRCCTRASTRGRPRHTTRTWRLAAGGAGPDGAGRPRRAGRAGAGPVGACR